VVIITRHGKPVAQIAPAPGAPKKSSSARCGIASGCCPAGINRHRPRIAVRPPLKVTCWTPARRLLALVTPERLSPAVLDALDRGPHSLSLLSYWEVLIQTMNSQLDVGDPAVADTLDQLAASALPLRPGHATGLYGVPPIHRDPFDRMLIAPAMAEDLDLVTTDRAIPNYANQRLRVISWPHP
jgi:PIN domain nuclease of toxin-antitoxin system